jgi:hypothetical protein
MDPNKTLADLRSLCTDVINTIERGRLASVPCLLEDTQALIGTFDDLDSWLADGGCSPKEWSVQND